MHRAARSVAPRAAQIASLQALRAIAAILVMLFHMQQFLPDFWGFSFGPEFFSRGESGVDVFFVLSGFIIYYTADRRSDLTRTNFVLARFVRVYPIYWVVVVLLIAAELGGVTNGHPYRLAPGTIVRSLALVPSDQYVLGVAWTLVLEVMFYLVFALTFFVSRRLFFLVIFAWSAVAVAARIVPVAEGAPTLVSGYLLYSGVCEFGFGACVGWLAGRGITRFAHLSLALGAAGFMLALVSPPIHALGREFEFGLPVAFLIYGVYCVNPRTPRLLVALGNASYVLYLIHGMTLSVLIRVAKRISLDALVGETVAAWGVAALTIAVAYAVHRLVEQPLLSWSKRRLLDNR